ncbi:MAG: oxaloacetate decarboxylase, gamma subunit [Treponematales bacterium]
MTIVEMLQQSGILTLLGMAIVFAFLWLMIICVNVTGKLVHAFGADKDVQARKETDGTVSAAKAGETTAAITAAVTGYRRTGGSE